jgi:Aerotolerance regulator N-terminal
VFLNLLLAGGMAAVAAPILVHIAHRRKIIPVDWAAMRFLQEMMRRSRSRLFIEQWLLLAVRTAAVLCLVLALMRPALAPKPIEEGGAGVVRQGRVAAVILFDDSASTSAGRGARSIERMKELAAAYVDTLEKGDEVSLIRLSRIGLTQADPLLDRQAAKDWISALQPTGFTSDVPGLLEAGLVQLARHFNPAAELVLVTDGTSEGWGLQDRGRWAEFQSRLARDGNDSSGGVGRPRLIVLNAGDARGRNNIAITEVRVDRSLVPVGRKVGIRARVRHAGEQLPAGLRIQFAIDGRVVEERPLRLQNGGAVEVTFSYSFAAGGSHSAEVRVMGARDAFGLDDRRALSVDVLERVKVLLVQEEAGEGLGGGLGFLHLALDPDGDGSRLFEVKRIAVGELASQRLHDYRAVALGSLSALDASSVAALERYVVGGGGLLVSLGGHTNAEHVNRFWAREGDGFLPCPLGDLIALQEPQTPASCNPLHPALSAFRGPSGEAWKSGEVRRYFSLRRSAVEASEMDVLLALESGDPLVLERTRGKGRVVLFTTSLEPTWNDLPARAAFVPLFRGIMAHLASQVQPPRNLRLGQRISHISSSGQPLIKSPDGKSVDVSLGSWEGRRAYLSPRLLEPGVYRLQPPGREGDICYALAADPVESRLEQLSAEARDGALARMKPVLLRSSAEVTEALDPANRRPVELWRYFLLASVCLLFVESAITRAQAVARRDSGGESS